MLGRKGSGSPRWACSMASSPDPRTLVPKVPARNVPADSWPQREGLGGEQTRLCSQREQQ